MEDQTTSTMPDTPTVTAPKPRRTKSLKVVLGFASLDDAMALEDCARTHRIPGRIIPLPSEIAAGCGLAWMASLADRETLVESLKLYNLTYEGIFEVLMY